jgi:signal transduction histidine kinase
LRLGQRVGDIETELRTSRAALGESESLIARERKDERQSLAGDLHDEVLPALFKVHLMGQVIKHDLDSGRLLDLEDDVRGLLDATSVAQGSIRDVVGSLRRSTLGARGFARSVAAFASELEASGAPNVSLQLDEVSGSDRSITVAFQVVREALSNAARYAKASHVWVTAHTHDAHTHDATLFVAVRDDGCGFDARPIASPEGHFGIDLMRERVQALGGSLVIDSRLGFGTTVSASIPAEQA